MKVCFLGGARYSQPLDATSEKKFQALGVLGQIFVIGFSTDATPRYFSQHARFYLFPCLPPPVLRYLLMFALGPVLTLWCILRHGVYILVAQSPYEGFAAAVAKVIARWFGKQVALVVESHGDFEVSLFLQRKIFMPGLYRYLMSKTARFAFRHADLLRAISNSTQEQLSKWASGKPLYQFPAWTDIDVFLEAGALRRQSGNEKLILYAGVLTPLKGIHFLIDAFAKVAKEIQDTRLWIVGKPENKEYAKGLKEQVKKLELAGRVTFLEPVPQRQLAEYMAQAQVLVLPSVSEGLGRVLFEAMACGTAVIGSNVDGIPEIIMDGDNGFMVPPKDVDSLAERLFWLLSHPQEAHEMGRRAREFAQRLFSKEAYVKYYTQLFEKASQVLEVGRVR